MDDKAGGFVDDEQGVVLIDNVERNVFGYNFPVALRVVQDERDDVAGLHLVVALDGLVAGMDCACLGCLLYAVAAGAGHVVHQELIDADGTLSLVNLYAPMLVLFLTLFKKVVIKQYVFLLFRHP